MPRVNAIGPDALGIEQMGCSQAVGSEYVARLRNTTRGVIRGFLRDWHSAKESSKEDDASPGIGMHPKSARCLLPSPPLPWSPLPLSPTSTLLAAIEAL